MFGDYWRDTVGARFYSSAWVEGAPSAHIIARFNTGDSRFTRNRKITVASFIKTKPWRMAFLKIDNTQRRDEPFISNHLSSYFASIALILAAVLCPLSVYGASFDCAKARAQDEKFVCNNPTISKLDDELGAIYQNTLSKTDPDQKRRLIEDQKHWLTNTRRNCTSEFCFKHAYWSRLAEVITFVEPKSLLYNKEVDKAPDIQKVLVNHPLFESVFSNPTFCNQIMDDLKQMNDIYFVDPVVQTQSYEDPALDPWKRQCKGDVPLNYSARCDPKILPVPNRYLLDECGTYYSTAPFKVFEIPSQKSSVEKRYIFYSDSLYGPMNMYVNPDWRKPIFAVGLSGFRQFAPPHCEKTVKYSSAETIGSNDGPNYNSIIEYKNQYYFLMLYSVTMSYWLDIRPIGINEVCIWGPVKPSSRQKVK